MNIGFKKQYFKELAELEAKNFWFRARNNIILWSIQKYAPAFRSFLEIGCGTGFVISAIAQRFPHASLAGSEFLEEGLVHARQRVPGAQFNQMDARHLSYSSELDVIGAFDVLEHIEEDRLVLNQIYRALKPGGMLFMTVPQHRWLWSSVDEYACHVRRYEAESLHEKVSTAGFEIVRSTSFISLLLPAMYLSRLFQKKTVPREMIDVVGLKINPILNWMFERLLALELLFIKAGVNLPMGGSRLIIAKK